MERELGGWNEDLQANMSGTRVGSNQHPSGDISHNFRFFKHSPGQLGFVCAKNYYV